MANNATINVQTKEWLYQSLIKLMKTHPYEKITITQIVQTAGVSRMGYYRNFESKDAILLDKVRVELTKLKQTMQRQQLVSEIDFWHLVIHQLLSSDLIKHVVQAGLESDLLQIHQRFTQDVLTNIFHWDLHDLNTQYLANYQMGGQIGLLLTAIQQPQPITSEQEQLMVDFIMAANRALLSLKHQRQLL